MYRTYKYSKYKRNKYNRYRSGYRGRYYKAYGKGYGKRRRRYALDEDDLIDSGETQLWTATNDKPMPAAMKPTHSSSENEDSAWPYALAGSVAIGLAVLFIQQKQ